MNKYFLHLSMLLVFSILSSANLNADTNPSKIKNIILIIGDGMGPGQIGLLEAYARQASNPIIKNRVTAFDRMLNENGVLGVSMTFAANVLVTDSAASATQLALGFPANSESIGADSEGNSHDSILSIAKKRDKATGIVSDVRLTHATPAAFAAHQPHRTLENEIAVDMLETGADVMLSGGLRHWIPEKANDQQSEIYKTLVKKTQGAVKIKSKRTDQRNLLDEASKQGYQLAFTKQQLNTSTDKVLGLFAYSAFPDAIIIDREKHNVNRTLPTLKEMSAKAIDILEKDEQGFFLMIESGMIDWAGHYNDTGTMLHEMLKINETINYVLDWANQREDTLIIVTADHETGGFGFSYSSANIPEGRELPGSVFDKQKFQPHYNFGAGDILDKLYNQKLSYTEIFYQRFDKLPTEQQTPQKLMEIVNENTEFNITIKQAARILETEDNPYYIEGHRTQSIKRVPKLSIHDAFFVYHKDDNRQNLLAIEVANQQSVVWSNGTHTATPVLVFANGDRVVTESFGKFMGHPEIGKKMIRIIEGKN